MHCRFRDRFPEPHHAGSQHAAASGANRDLRRHIGVSHDAAFNEAAIVEQVAVEFDNFVATSPLVQPIDILRNERHLRYEARKCNECMVTRIRLHTGNQFATPAVPAPYQRGIALESFRCRQLVRIVLFPETGLRLAKGGDTAFRGNAGTGQDADVLCGT